MVGGLRGVKFAARRHARPRTGRRRDVRHRRSADLSGPALTTASRAVVFLYTAPSLFALGSTRISANALRASQWDARTRPEFCRSALAPACRSPNVDASVLLGDLCDRRRGAMWRVLTPSSPKGTARCGSPRRKGAGV